MTHKYELLKRFVLSSISGRVNYTSNPSVRRVDQPIMLPSMN
jgi:hypothetical protein